jgi:hypothetical protein
MRTYSEFRPTSHDSAGLGLDDRQSWLVAPCGTNRDAGAWTRSNWETQLASLGDSDDVEVHRFGHWGPGWFEIAIVRPGSDAAKEAERIESALEDYPVLDDEHFSQTEREEADEVWSKCYTTEARLAYIERHRSQFEFDSMADLMGCVRGKFFAGYASELLA